MIPEESQRVPAYGDEKGEVPMTELETLQRAKMYLDKMANGIDPLTDQPVSENDCINQVRISRCLFYISDILRRVIENGGNVGKPATVKKQPFSISHDMLRKFPLSDTPIPVSEITRRVNELIDSAAMTKLKHTSITTFLLQSGFLAEEQTGEGKTRKTPTEHGRSIGISTEERVYQSGTYQVTVYNVHAQQFIMDNMDAVIEINNQKLPSNQGDFQGQSWTTTHDEVLADLFKKEVPISEIAVTLKRSNGAVRARLKKLGLME